MSSMIMESRAQMWNWPIKLGSIVEQNCPLFAWNSQDVINVCASHYNHSCPFPNSASMLIGIQSRPIALSIINLPHNTGPSSFQITSYAPGDTLYCKMGQHNANWKSVATYKDNLCRARVSFPCEKQGKSLWSPDFMGPFFLFRRSACYRQPGRSLTFSFFLLIACFGWVKGWMMFL